MKTFIITGTNKGLGEAMVAAIMENSDDLVIAISRRLSENQMKYDNKRFLFVECDLSLQNINEKMQIIRDSVPSEEIVFINNASLIAPISKVGEFEECQIEELISVNVKAPIVISNFLLKNFQSKRITIINISSGAAERPIKSWSLYCSSKASLKMFFEVMKSENPKHTFHNIDPGIMDTDMQFEIRNSEFEGSREFIDFKNGGVLKSPHEVAKRIIFELI